MISRAARVKWVYSRCPVSWCHSVLGSSFRSSSSLARSQDAAKHELLRTTRNIGIIAHIDAGKTTTTERMLYYSGFTRRIGDVDDGSTVTDFLPAERARGITIQSAAITFRWPPRPAADVKHAPALLPPSHTINLIDTPGHADFTFEVIRSLRILDGAICILDGVAGVEAQTEKVWHQANGYQIPRLVYVNKLDRDGATFNRTVKEIGSKLNSWPALCQIPWWRQGRFIGVGDVLNMRGLSWDGSIDGSTFATYTPEQIQGDDPDFAAELLRARTALVELLTEHDATIVESFLEHDEDFAGLPGDLIVDSIRRILLCGGQKITPVFAGASFHNIGVQPLLDATNKLLPSPPETVEPVVAIAENSFGIRNLSQASHSAGRTQSLEHANRITSLALAFKVVNDAKRGVLVYIRVYSGSIKRNALLYNTNLSLSERAQRLLRMYASDALEVPSIEEGQIGVIAGLRHARTGDTLLVYQGMNSKTGPPTPINGLQLQPVTVPPPLFYTSVEPSSLTEQKNLEEAMAILLREDPSLSVSMDAESGQTHLAGMGELHLEIARDRLINDFKVTASTGKIEIGYREVIQSESEPCTRTFEREVAGKKTFAEVQANVAPLYIDGDETMEIDDNSHVAHLPDNNILTISHLTLRPDGRSRSDTPSLPQDLPLRTIVTALQSGVQAALARGPSHSLPAHSIHTTIDFDQSTAIDSSTTPAALVAAARMATTAALKAAASTQPSALLEPVMLANIAVTDSSLGAVVHDLTAARGAQILSLDVDADADTSEEAGNQSQSTTRRLTPAQLSRVYAPPDPFGSTASESSNIEIDQMRTIRARVPLKEMVGYLKILRSLTGGRGTFVMSVDRFERMGSQRAKVALSEMSGDFA